MENSEQSVATENFSFTQAEKTILKFWKEKDIFKKSLEKTKSGKNYIFYLPLRRVSPITVTSWPRL